MNRELVETFVENEFCRSWKNEKHYKTRYIGKMMKRRKQKIGDKNKNDPATVSRENIVVITCLTQTILRFMEIGIPAKISTGITKWMQNRFELVEWTTRNEIRCGCEDPRRVRNIFHLKAFHFETLDILSCVSPFRNPSGNPIYRGRVLSSHERQSNDRI